MKKVRVRFAPSPTGGLHLGGVRTVLYNYLFAHHLGGEFILRIEDTDQSRFVEGAEQYIIDCLNWCGLTPDEGPHVGGPYAPYRQSERKANYRSYAQQLIDAGHAYIAFDTPEELEEMRVRYKTEEDPQPQYNARLRSEMRNSLTLGEQEVEALLDEGTPHVIRIRMPEHEELQFTDLIRGDVSFQSGTVDDKVLIKADGMPTYHLAVVVDDYLMKITHAFRGEEWLPSAPVHVMLWKYLFGLDKMPAWAHLPLILGPNGKLSKRDGARYGFPVFAKNWTDQKTKELTEGFLEKGFLPEAFINLLALLGWNDGTEQELFTLHELIDKFSMERVHSAGARFDYEKAKWFNHEWIKRLDAPQLLNQVLGQLTIRGIDVPDVGKLQEVIALVKERCTLLSDFVPQTSFFFQAPSEWDADAVRPKWTMEKKKFFQDYIAELSATPDWESAFIEDAFKLTAAQSGIKPGELQLPMRIMLVGGKFGPPVFDIAAMIGKQETLDRINRALDIFEPR